MSVDINWQTLTEGPDGEALAETIRQSINDRFQQVNLPKIIRSVKVNAFDFGSVAPEIVLKDICNPLPDFYEDDHSSDEGSQDGTGQQASPQAHAGAVKSSPSTRRNSKDARQGRRLEPGLRTQAASPAPSRGGQTSMLGGHSNLGYFHLPLHAGLSGTATPLAAVAGAHYNNGTSRYAPSEYHAYQRSSSLASITPPEVSPPPSHRHMSQHPLSGASTPDAEHIPEPSPEDIQIVTHVSYSGDVKLGMTAEVFLDYPMPSFVGIPLKLSITGLSFDGVAVLAYIKRRAHLCFLSPEDADALIGGEAVNLDSPRDEKNLGNAKNSAVDGGKFLKRPGGLLEDIKIETEIGQTEDGKQVLKNVGKIEKFILEQVQRIFEDEFVYPSFWTFLV